MFVKLPLSFCLGLVELRQVITMSQKCIDLVISVLVQCCLVIPGTDMAVKNSISSMSGDLSPDLSATDLEMVCI